MRTVLGAVMTMFGACLTNSAFATSTMPCEHVRDKVDQFFVRSFPLAEQELDKEMIGKLQECTVSNEVCMVGFHRGTDKKSSVFLRSAKKLGETVNSKWTLDQELVYGLVQIPKTQNGGAACIAATNLFAHVEPWAARAWRIKDGQVEHFDLRAGYDLDYANKIKKGKDENIFTISMAPDVLARTMVNLYNYREYRLANPSKPITVPH
jgi:hypothetical protein